MPVPPQPPAAPPALWPPKERTAPNAELVRTLATRMLTARALDQDAVRWQRQGLLPAFPPALGQEAAQVGSASALERRDFAFITYRDHGVVIGLDADIFDYMISHLGLWNGGFANPHESRYTPLQAVVGSTGLHAVGWALAAKRDGSGAASIAYFGDGASSQGDIHEAMNFAGVMGAPTVFFVQNNQWSLSTSIEKQVAGLQVGPRAAGYNMPMMQIDGDDVLEVFEATQIALANAREHGPVLVEAFTYRRGPHATSDDPSRYRTLAEEQAAGTDPIDRIREAVGDDAWFEAEAERVQRVIDRVHEQLLAQPAVPGADMFDYVFQEPTPQLRRQQEQWREESDHA